MTYAGLLATATTLPAEVVNAPTGTNTITATTWTVLPTTTADATITNPSSVFGLFVQVSFGAWMLSNGNNTQATIGASGGLTFAAGPGTGGPAGWGEILYLGNTAGSSSWQMHSTFTCTIPAAASAVTFAWYAYRTSASGTCNVNYPVTRVTPLYYI